MMIVKLRFVLLSTLLLGMFGCSRSGPNLGGVTGTVTLDGTPLASVCVQFEPEYGRSASAVTDANGVYRLQYTSKKKGALVGVHTVRISTRLPMTGNTMPERLPAKYNKESTLTAEVKPGGNEIDFQLTSR